MVVQDKIYSREETRELGKTERKHRLKQRFEVVRKLGQGTYGKVQLAINKETGQQVAIKTIKKAKIENDQDLLRIRREIQIMSSIQHPHIIHIYEVFENHEKIVLIMQYASGGELYDYLGGRKDLAEAEARRIFRQIASAVYYCHKNKICHRDLKLENILLDEKKNAKIADFGLSNVFDDRHQLRTFCGSPLYASPEIVKGTPYYGPEVDCWSLGVLLYTLVYGAMPFDGSNFKRLVRQISEGDYYEPKKRSDASGLIRRLLTISPRKRGTIIDICTDWWVNRGYEHSLLKVAEDMAILTPVHIELLHALAPVSPSPGDDSLLKSRSRDVKPKATFTTSSEQDTDVSIENLESDTSSPSDGQSRIDRDTRRLNVKNSPRVSDPDSIPIFSNTNTVADELDRKPEEVLIGVFKEVQDLVDDIVMQVALVNTHSPPVALEQILDECQQQTDKPEVEEAKSSLTNSNQITSLQGKETPTDARVEHAAQRNESPSVNLVQTTSDMSKHPSVMSKQLCGGMDNTSSSVSNKKSIGNREQESLHIVATGRHIPVTVNKVQSLTDKSTQPCVVVPIFDVISKTPESHLKRNNDKKPVTVDKNDQTTIKKCTDDDTTKDKSNRTSEVHTGRKEDGISVTLNNVQNKTSPDRNSTIQIDKGAPDTTLNGKNTQVSVSKVEHPPSSGLCVGQEVISRKSPETVDIVAVDGGIKSAAFVETNTAPVNRIDVCNNETFSAEMNSPSAENDGKKCIGTLSKDTATSSGEKVANKKVTFGKSDTKLVDGTRTTETNIESCRGEGKLRQVQPYVKGPEEDLLKTDDTSREETVSTEEPHLPVTERQDRERGREGTLDRRNLTKPRRRSLSRSRQASIDEMFEQPKKVPTPAKRLPGKIQIPKTFHPEKSEETTKTSEKKVVIPVRSVSDTKKVLETKIEQEKKATAVPPRRKSEAKLVFKLPANPPSDSNPPGLMSEDVVLHETVSSHDAVTTAEVETHTLGNSSEQCDSLKMVEGNMGGVEQAKKTSNGSDSQEIDLHQEELVNKQRETSVSTDDSRSIYLVGEHDTPHALEQNAVTEHEAPSNCTLTLSPDVKETEKPSHFEGETTGILEVKDNQHMQVEVDAVKDDVSSYSKNPTVGSRVVNQGLDSSGAKTTLADECHRNSVDSESGYCTPPDDRGSTSEPNVEFMPDPISVERSMPSNKEHVNKRHPEKWASVTRPVGMKLNKFPGRLSDEGLGSGSLSSSVESDMNSWRLEEGGELRRLSPEGETEAKCHTPHRSIRHGKELSGPAPVTRSCKVLFARDRVCKDKLYGQWTEANVEHKERNTVSQTEEGRKDRAMSPLAQSNSQSSSGSNDVSDDALGSWFKDTGNLAKEVRHSDGLRRHKERGRGTYRSLDHEKKIKEWWNAHSTDKDSSDNDDDLDLFFDDSHPIIYGAEGLWQYLKAINKDLEKCKKNQCKVGYLRSVSHDSRYPHSFHQADSRRPISRSLSREDRHSVNHPVPKTPTRKLSDAVDANWPQQFWPSYEDLSYSRCPDYQRDDDKTLSEIYKWEREFSNSQSEDISSPEAIERASVFATFRPRKRSESSWLRESSDSPAERTVFKEDRCCSHQDISDGRDLDPWLSMSDLGSKTFELNRPRPSGKKTYHKSHTAGIPNSSRVSLYGTTRPRRLSWNDRAMSQMLSTPELYDAMPEDKYLYGSLDDWNDSGEYIDSDDVPRTQPYRPVHKTISQADIGFDRNNPVKVTDAEYLRYLNKKNHPRHSTRHRQPTPESQHSKSVGSSLNAVPSREYLDAWRLDKVASTGNLSQGRQIMTPQACVQQEKSRHWRPSQADIYDMAGENISLLEALQTQGYRNIITQRLRPEDSGVRQTAANNPQFTEDVYEDIYKQSLPQRTEVATSFSDPKGSEEEEAEDAVPSQERQQDDGMTRTRVTRAGSSEDSNTAIDRLAEKIKILKERCHRKERNPEVPAGEGNPKEEVREESVSDRIWRKSFYSRFNETRPTRRRKSGYLDGDYLTDPIVGYDNDQWLALARKTLLKNPSPVVPRYVPASRPEGRVPTSRRSTVDYTACPRRGHDLDIPFDSELGLFVCRQPRVMPAVDASLARVGQRPLWDISEIADANELRRGFAGRHTRSLGDQYKGRQGATLPSRYSGDEEGGLRPSTCGGGDGQDDPYRAFKDKE